MEKKCECCEKVFETYSKKQKNCSRSCGQCNKRQTKIKVECEFTGCTEMFEKLPNGEKRFCSRDCQVQWQKYSQLGENNGNFGRKNKWGSHSPEMRKLISEKITESWKKEDRVTKHNDARERYKDKYGYLPTNSPSARQKRSDLNVKRYLENDHLTTYNTAKKGYFFNKKNNINEYYHSSWEEKLMIEMDNNDEIVNWTKKHGIVIKYYHDGITKSYLPDFFIEYSDGRKVIEEVKGYVSDVEVFKLKNEAAKKYCLENGFTYKVNFMSNENKYKNLII